MLMYTAMRLQKSWRNNYFTISNRWSRADPHFDPSNVTTHGFSYQCYICSILHIMIIVIGTAKKIGTWKKCQLVETELIINVRHANLSNFNCICKLSIYYAVRGKISGNKYRWYCAIISTYTKNRVREEYINFYKS